MRDVVTQTVSNCVPNQFFDDGVSWVSWKIMELTMDYATIRRITTVSMFSHFFTWDPGVGWLPLLKV